MLGISGSDSGRGRGSGSTVLDLGGLSSVQIDVFMYFWHLVFRVEMGKGRVSLVLDPLHDPETSGSLDYYSGLKNYLYYFGGSLL